MPNLIRCAACRKKISRNAPACPKCGEPVSTTAIPIEYPQWIQSAAAIARKVVKWFLILTLIGIPLSFGSWVGWLYVIAGSAVFAGTFRRSEKPLEHKKLLRIILPIIVFMGFSAIVSEETVNAPNAKNYQVIQDQDIGFPGRNRVRWIIVSPEAKTMAEFADTAKKAALDARKKTSAAVISVWLEHSSDLIGTGDQLAIVSFIPDGRGNSGDEKSSVWEVEAADRRFTDQELAVATAWKRYREGFLDPDGFLNETELKKAISERLKIPVSSIKLPFNYRKKCD
jgi:hypothetical protein